MSALKKPDIYRPVTLSVECMKWDGTLNTALSIAVWISGFGYETSSRDNSDALSLSKPFQTIDVPLNMYILVDTMDDFVMIYDETSLNKRYHLLKPF